jgi:chemotaxis protein histidine kinase CheA
MNDQQAFLQRLRAIFADEAREHLRHIEAGLAALEQAGADAHAGLLEPVLKHLHTLKGAARAVDIDALEHLCHALEGVCTAAAARPAFGAADFDQLGRAVALARALTEAPSGRLRNQAVALCAELERMVARLAAPGAGPGAASREAAPDVPAPVPDLEVAHPEAQHDTAQTCRSSCACRLASSTRSVPRWRPCSAWSWGCATRSSSCARSPRPWPRSAAPAPRATAKQPRPSWNARAWRANWAPPAARCRQAGRS